ncbi:MAG: hypothetical protein K9K79_05870 [Desulfohalobiaceae bacterium]|nr:hypothetical protein [Desulfohalobiaceae bacterium]
MSVEIPSEENHYDLVELDRAGVNDLDLGQVVDYFSRYTISFIEEPEQERLRLMQHADILGEHYRPTVAGLLIFGINPERYVLGSSVSFAHFAGREITMENLGFVDKLGRGLPMVCQEARKLGHRVEFEESGQEFKVVLPLTNIHI